MPAAHLVLLGGVRSGKSRRAAALATAMAAPADVIVTAYAAARFSLPARPVSESFR